MALNQRKIDIFLMLAAVVLGCTNKVFERQRVEEKITEAVVRKEIADWYGSLELDLTHPKDKLERDVAESLNFQTIYVAIQDKDPSDQLLSHLQLPGKMVKKLSESTGRPSPRDKISGKQGILFVVGPVKWMQDQSVQVNGEYWCGGLCSAEYLYKLHLQNGLWTVDSAQLIWIS